MNWGSAIDMGPPRAFKEGDMMKRLNRWVMGIYEYGAEHPAVIPFVIIGLFSVIVVIMAPVILLLGEYIEWLLHVIDPIYEQDSSGGE